MSVSKAFQQENVLKEYEFLKKINVLNEYEFISCKLFL